MAPGPDDFVLRLHLASQTSAPITRMSDEVELLEVHYSTVPGSSTRGLRRNHVTLVHLSGKLYDRASALAATYRMV